jgi:hypothetical protein
MRVGRKRKVRISSKARTKAFGRASRAGARTPAQIRAAIMREATRPRSSWRRSAYKRQRYGR